MSIRERLITIDVESLLEIPFAYKKAIEKYKQDPDLSNCNNYDIWNGSIEMIKIDFQDNFKRTEYTCVFKITDKS